MTKEIFYHFLINFFLENHLIFQIFLKNPANLPKISPDMRDIFRNLSLKSEYPLNRGSLNRCFLTLEKSKKNWDQTVLSVKCGYPLN